MRIWLIQDGEPLLSIDPGTRDWRCGILAKMLVVRGHEVLWWASTFNHAAKRHRFNETRIVEIMHGLRIILLHGPGYSHNKSLKRFLHHRILANAFAKKTTNTIKPDLIFSSLPTLELAEQAVIYGQRTRVPVVVDIRDLWPDHYLTLVPPQLRGLLRLVLSMEFWRARRLLKGATGITAISTTFLNWGLKHAGRPQREADGVFPMGYPTTQLAEDQILSQRKELISRYGIRTDSLNVTFVGSISSVFDFKTVLEAARILQGFQDNIQFIIVGDGTNYSQVRDKAQGLNNLIFTGRLDQISVAAILGLTAVGLTPYAEGESISGSLPNKPFEYMSAGLPILSSHRGDLERLIWEMKIGLQYQVRNVSSLVQKIRWFKANPTERQAMGLRSRKLFEERFSAKVIYPKLADHLEMAAKGVNLLKEC